jgi:subtilisin family serine protease/tetratricopeptide (TPR) repeat protein
MLHRSFIAAIFVAFEFSFGFGLRAHAQISTQDGKVFATEITVKFRSEVVQLAKGKLDATLSDIPVRFLQVRNFFAEFGDVRFHQEFEGASYGDTLKRSITGEIVNVPDLSQFFRVVFPEPTELWKTVNKARLLPEIEWADPPLMLLHERTPNDLQSSQWNLTKVGATNAWDITTGSSSISVAVIDQGVDWTHEDLSSKLTGGESTTSGSHGTEVAGVVGAATDNGKGIASLGWNVMIMPFDDGDATDGAADIYSAVNQGAKVVNCSFITVELDPSDTTKYVNYDDYSMSQAVTFAQNQGRLVVASAGNPPAPIPWPNGATKYPNFTVPYTCWPAAYSGVVGVSATNSLDQFPSGYNYGSLVKVSAPGINIKTTGVSNTYPTVDGTSFSAPLVCALAGLIWSKNPSVSANQVTNTIYLSADDLGPSGWDDHFGYGRINANNAVRNLYVPQVYSTIASALNAATSGQTVIVASGSYSQSSTITVPSGVTLQLNSGVTITFSGSSTKLVVNGYLYSGNVVLQGNGTEGSWYGIEMNGSGASVGGCTIKDAYYAISLINSGGTHSWNHLQNDRYGINCVNYSNPAMVADVFQEDGWAVAGDNTCLPYLGSSASYPGNNSFRDNDFYDVYSTYAGTVYARGNWWGASPPYPSVTQNVDYQEWLSYDPNPRGQSVTTELVGLQFSKRVTGSSSELISPGVVPTPEPGMSELDTAYLLYVEGKYAEALQAFEAVVAGYPDNFAGRRALVFVERTLDKLGRSSEILATLNTASASYSGKALGEFADARRVYQYLNQGRYQDAVTQAAEIVRLNDDTTLVKFALYDLGSLYWYYVGDTKTGEQYYRQLIARFPKDHLTNSALATLGEWKPEEPSEKAGNASLGQSKEPPAQYALTQNYPNPFNPSTVISYQLPTGGHVTLKLYNTLGQEVATLVDGIQDAGLKSVTFDATRFPSGVYFYRLQSGTFVQNRKMLLVK